MLGGLAAAGLALAFWMVVVERRLFRVRRVVLDAGNLGLPPMKILHLTDTHFSGRDKAILAFLRNLSATERFDLVLFTGDLIDRASGVESAATAASLFRPNLGSFAVLGGHDYPATSPLKAYTHMLLDPRGALAGPNPAGELAARLEECGVRVLQDDNVRLTAADGRPFALVALRDAYVFEPNFRAAWQGLPAEVPVVVIAHSPDVIDEAVARAARLAFFGHTHGGQVRLPFIGAVVGRSRLPLRLVRGAFRQGQTVFIINHGLGTSPVVPYRLLCRPEVTVAEIVDRPGLDALTPIGEAGLG
jgi:predicted MPP superfamily phosphohydrolase